MRKGGMMTSDEDENKDLDDDMTMTEDESLNHAQFRAQYFRDVADSWKRAVTDAIADHAVPLEALGGNELAYQRGCRDVIVEIERWQRRHLSAIRTARGDQ